MPLCEDCKSQAETTTGERSGIRWLLPIFMGSTDESEGSEQCDRCGQGDRSEEERVEAFTLDTERPSRQDGLFDKETAREAWIEAWKQARNRDELSGTRRRTALNRFEEWWRRNHE